ncbi:cupin domain-containing protein [Macrococcus sp. EM39E]|uniref:cupin domain-containing protein n=1 Tax=Macrococcus animalis TaxID=3395467 RepID=UPI0039BE8233
MEKYNISNQLSDTNEIQIIEFFKEVLESKGIEGTLNYVEIPGNLIVPESGQSIHEYDEISFIISGELEAIINGEKKYIKPGDYTLIKKGVPHISRNLNNEPCKLVCLLI